MQAADCELIIFVSRYIQSTCATQGNGLYEGGGHPDASTGAVAHVVHEIFNFVNTFP